MRYESQLRVFLLFVMSSCPTISQNTYVYAPSKTNPPHGCPNYGLCSNPTKTLVSAVNTTYTYVLGCASSADCVCNDGTTNGTVPCDTINDNCTPNPCSTDPKQHWVCNNGINSHTCTCAAGYSGDTCQYATSSACADSPCQNGGKCNDAPNSTLGYNCTCTNNNYGDNCQTTNWCAPSMNTCKNGGVCEPSFDNSTYYCNCTAEFQGRNCEVSNVIQHDPLNDGCWTFTSDLDDSSKYKKNFDYKMDIEECESQARGSNPPAEFFAVCQQLCYSGASNPLKQKIDPPDGKCTYPCGGDNSEKCGWWGSRCWVYNDTNYEYKNDPCADDPSLCNANATQGLCINLDKDYQCVCSPNFSGNQCQTPIVPACNNEPCQNNGTCIWKMPGNTYTCDCEEGFKGPQCQYELACKSTSCRNGGTCSEANGGSFTCACLEYYSGKSCQIVDRCKYANPCVQGDCSSTPTSINPFAYSCKCYDGYNGTNCDKMVDYCESGPCKHGATCTPFFKGYSCNCVTGVTGKNCETVISQCVPYKDSSGSWHPTPCNSKDNGAVCTVRINGYACNCTSEWTGPDCDLNVIIRNVLIAIYGEVNTKMIPLLNDLMNNPSQIKDMVPFITGLLDGENRTSLSWSAEDLFLWVAFEEKRLDFNKDIVQWNDVVLGNCFTFNYRTQNTTFEMRMLGDFGGFQALMRVRQDEYAPWYDTAAILVFIHNKGEYVFSESVRYNAEPNTGIIINVYDTHFTRLGGKYGVCIQDPSQVKAYYYPGDYNTDGCLRTCYQDMILEKCECMDPRYPKPADKSSCTLEQRSCVDNAAAAAGDPSSWPSCVCPLPCTNQEYSVTWSRAVFVNQPIECDTSPDPNNCESKVEDQVLVTVNLPKLDFQIYKETPAMDFNKFISSLGGLLGVLMGVSIISFIELVFLVAKVVIVLVGKN